VRYTAACIASCLERNKNKLHSFAMDSTDSQKFSKTLDAWLSKMGRRRKHAVSGTVNSFFVMFSLWAAYSLRQGMAFGDFKSTWHFLFFLPVVAVVIFMSFSIYRWVERSSNNSLVKQQIKSFLASSLFL